MSKKIVILGLGYVGLEICHLYQNNRDDEIIVIDGKFYDCRVAQIRKWGIKFYQRDIFDIKDLIKDTDIVYNTISITSVPQRKDQETPEINSVIHKIGTEGNRYVIENISDQTKLIFLSSHVVFEGYKNEFNIIEDKEPKPLLSYGLSKRQSEIDLINSNKNFIIGRLASTYGHNMAFRIGIVTNILSKMAAVERKIKITNQNSFKPLAGTRDVARALKHLAEGNYNREIYHIVNENITIDQIAQICKKYVEDLEIEYVIGEKDNMGYTLSANKLLNVGFKFKQTVESEMFNMIRMWKN